MKRRQLVTAVCLATKKCLRLRTIHCLSNCRWPKRARRFTNPMGASATTLWARSAVRGPEAFRRRLSHTDSDFSLDAVGHDQNLQLSALAPSAVERRAARLHDASNGSAAAFAGLALAVINI